MVEVNRGTDHVESAERGEELHVDEQGEAGRTKRTGWEVDSRLTNTLHIERGCYGGGGVDGGVRGEDDGDEEGYQRKGGQQKNGDKGLSEEDESRAEWSVRRLGRWEVCGGDERSRGWVGDGWVGVAGDGVAGIKRRRRDLSSDGVKNLATALGRDRLKEDL
ncbi:hypothetical protein Tco_1295185 [Tanacetum coccineum]